MAYRLAMASVRIPKETHELFDYIEGKLPLNQEIATLGAYIGLLEVEMLREMVVSLVTRVLQFQGITPNFSL